MTHTDSLLAHHSPYFSSQVFWFLHSLSFRPPPRGDYTPPCNHQLDRIRGRCCPQINRLPEVTSELQVQVQQAGPPGTSGQCEGEAQIYDIKTHEKYNGGHFPPLFPLPRPCLPLASCHAQVRSTHRHTFAPTQSATMMYKAMNDSKGPQHM